MAKKAKDTISIGFEEKIWKAADILRGNLSASQYEGVVLGLIFLKYISDRFEQKHAELSEDEYADPEDKDEYTADNIFFVPQEARWSNISAAAHTPEIGVTIDAALAAIERENERLKGSCLRTSHVRSWTSVVWARWWTSSPTLRCMTLERRKTSLAAHTNTAFSSLLRLRARTEVSSILLPA